MSNYRSEVEAKKSLPLHPVSQARTCKQELVPLLFSHSLPRQQPDIPDYYFEQLLRASVRTPQHPILSLRLRIGFHSCQQSKLDVPPPQPTLTATLHLIPSPVRHSPKRHLRCPLILSDTTSRPRLCPRDVIFLTFERLLVGHVCLRHTLSFLPARSVDEYPSPRQTIWLQTVRRRPTRPRTCSRPWWPCAAQSVRPRSKPMNTWSDSRNRYDGRPKRKRGGQQVATDC
jgi:hypothetical protein